MGKKYLDTKKNSLEDAVLEVFIKESVLAGRDYKYDGKGPIKISKKMYGKVKKDSKSMIKGKPYMMALNPKTQGTELVPVKFEEVELDESLKTTHVLIDTSKNNEVIGTASDEKGIKQVYNNTARYTKKSVLKIVKLKKPASGTKTDKLFGYPLHKWGEEVDMQESGHTDVSSMKTQVQIAMDALQKMNTELAKLNDEDDLPTWWTNKVATAVNKLDGMADYISAKGKTT